MASSNVALGVRVDLSETGGQHSTIVFHPVPERVQHCLEVWHNASVEGRMTPPVASTLRGKTNFLLEGAQGRVGRAPSLVLVQREHHDTEFGFTAAMEHAHEFYRALLPRLPPRRASVVPPAMLPLLVYTDAMWRPRKRQRREAECVGSEFRRRFVTRLGIVLYDPHCDPRHPAFNPQLVGGCPHGHLRYGSAIPPDDVTATFARSDTGDPLKTYIAQLEVLAGVSVYYTFPDAVRGRQVNHFIDNTVALSGLVHGYARKLDLARMVNAFHLQLVSLDAHVWLEFVPSKANIADLPSRDEYELLEHLGGRRASLRMPPAADWQSPLQVWLERGAPAQ